MRPHLTAPSVFSLPLALFLLALPLALTPRAAIAQNAMPQPETAAQGTPFDPDDLDVDFDAAFSSIDNVFLSDVLKLNYQINLLDRMVERQAQIAHISDSMAAMGAKYEQPAPPRGICEQLPANAPCLKFYPDLYPDTVASRKAYYAELSAKAAASNPYVAPEGESKAQAKARRARIEKEKKERLEREARAERRTRYQWTDVRCKLDSCRAVLISEKKPGYRATVEEGSVLTDGTLVRRISADGVSALIGGEVIAIRPAPSSADAGADTKDPTSRFYNGIDAANQGTKNAAPSGGVDLTHDASAAAAAVIANIEKQKAASPTATGAPPIPPAASAGAPNGGANGAEQKSGANAIEQKSGANAAGQTTAEPALGPSGLF